MCDNFKCYSLNVVHACSIVVHKWIWMLGYISPLFLCFFQRSLFLFFTLVSVVFLNPFMDFDSVKFLEYAGTFMMEVPDNVHVNIGRRRQVFYCRPGVSLLSPDLYCRHFKYTLHTHQRLSEPTRSKLLQSTCSQLLKDMEEDIGRNVM